MRSSDLRISSDKNDVRQVSTFLYCLGEGAEDVLTSTGITPQEKAKYDKVLEKFDNFFQVRKTSYLREPGLTRETKVKERRPTSF